MADAPKLPPKTMSPRWGSLTKFLVSLIAAVIIGSLFSRFQEMVGPLVFAFVLAYLLSPLIARVTHSIRLPWGTAVVLTYLILVLLLIAVLVVAGFALEQQIAGLYQAVVKILPDLPNRVKELLSHPLPVGPFTFDFSRPMTLGPFTLDFSTLNLQPLYDQLIAALQPALSQTGNVVGSLASGTATVLGWAAFVFIISFYLLHDLKDVVPSIEELMPDGYEYDVRRLAAELGPIWNAFLRGQVTIALTSGLAMALLLGVTGVRFAPVLGLIAFFSEFVPLVGPTLSGLIGVLVAFFQVGNWLGLSPFTLALVVLIIYTVWQQIQNNVIVPRILGHSLKLHPIIIIIGAIIAANLAGFVGLVLAAPLVATLRLFGGYLYRKMLDLDPWPAVTPVPTPPRRREWPRWLKIGRPSSAVSPPPSAVSDQASASGQPANPTSEDGSSPDT